MISFSSTGLRQTILKLAASGGSMRAIAREGEAAGAQTYATALKARIFTSVHNGGKLALRLKADGSNVEAPAGTARVIRRLINGGTRHAGEGGPVFTGALARAGRVGSIASVLTGSRRFFGTITTRYGDRRGVWERLPGGGLRALVILATKGEYERQLAVDGLKEISIHKARATIAARLRSLR